MQNIARISTALKKVLWRSIKIIKQRDKGKFSVNCRTLKHRYGTRDDESFRWMQWTANWNVNEASAETAKSFLSESFSFPSARVSGWSPSNHAPKGSIRASSEQPRVRRLFAIPSFMPRLNKYLHGRWMYPKANYSKQLMAKKATHKNLEAKMRNSAQH